MISLFQTSRWALCLAVLLFPAVATGHPFHFSTAELEFNPRTNKVEVSLKLQSVDLEKALARLSHATIDLNQEASDALIQQFLDDHFFLISAAEAKLLDSGETEKPSALRSKVSLVGKELKTAWMWLYFEMDVPVTSGDYALVNTILLDIAEGQINTVSVRHDAKRDALQMNRKQPWGTIPLQWLGGRGVTGRGATGSPDVGSQRVDVRQSGT